MVKAIHRSPAGWCDSEQMSAPLRHELAMQYEDLLEGKHLIAHFGDRLGFVFRNFPLSEIHPWAEPAAQRAGAQGQFWEMHDLLFARQTNLDSTLLDRLSDRLRLQRSQVKSALRDYTYSVRIRADFMGGVRSGMNGTSTFFFDGQREDGALDYASLPNSIDKTLRAPAAAHG